MIKVGYIKIPLLFVMMFFCFSVFSQHQAMQDNKTKKWGFVSKGVWVIKPAFDDCDRYNSFSRVRNYAIVKKDGYWGSIDEKGNFISKPVFKSSASAVTAALEMKKKSAVSNFIFCGFDIPSQKWGFVNYYGDWVIKPLFDDVDSEMDLEKDKKYALVKYQGVWGCIDKKGKFVVKPVFVEKDEAKKAGTEWAAYTPLGKSVYVGYDVQLKKYGFVNSVGNWVVKPNFTGYDPSYTFSDNHPFAVVKYGAKWGCINRLGKYTVKPSYPKAAAAKSAGFAWQSKYKASLPAANTLANYDDGKHKQSLLVSGSGYSAQNNVPVYNNVPYNNNVSAGTKPPTINILTPKNGDSYTASNVTFTYEAKTADGKPAEIIAYINGELQPRTKGVKRVGNQMSLTLPRNVEDCRVQLIAKDANGQNSDPAVVLLHYKGNMPKPNLHVMAVGVSDYNQADLKLQHASKDANDFINAISACNVQKHYQTLKKPVLITDKMATDKNIKKGLSNIVNSVEQGDVVMLFFSGHGSKEGNDTYFLSVNAESDDLFSSAVNFDDIRSATRRLKDKKCKVLIFMDACHSGALYGQKSTTENFAFSEPGVIGFYSSTESQKSNESEKWSNGIFTKALIEGLKGKAVDADGNITLDNLEKYIRETVRKATNGKQMPIFENKQGNFILFGK